MLFNIKGMFLKDIVRDSQLQPKNAILKLGILYIVKRTFPKFCRSTRFGAESNGVARDWKE